MHKLYFILYQSVMFKIGAIHPGFEEDRRIELCTATIAILTYFAVIKGYYTRIKNYMKV